MGSPRENPPQSNRRNPFGWDLDQVSPTWGAQLGKIHLKIHLKDLKIHLKMYLKEPTSMEPSGKTHGGVATWK